MALWLLGWAMHSDFISNSHVVHSRRTTFFGVSSLRRVQNHAFQGHLLSMRDSSASYWFQVGDRVRVIENVLKNGDNNNGWNLKGMDGIVMETWEKCDVDPTCCCAEQVDTGMAVRVEFTPRNSTLSLEEHGTMSSLPGMANATNPDSAGNGSVFFHYFAENELVKVKDTVQ